MNALLKPAELLYRGINRLRRSAYRAGLLKSKRLPKPVVSVGNIATGGTGKTPAVIAICRFLEQRGLRVCVLTRGYGGSGSGIVDGLDAGRFGDEPVVIKKSTQMTTVIVGANRYENAVGRDCDVFVLDDGFQHLQLDRDLDIVIDAPSRFYREGRSALRDADVVVPRRIRMDVPQALRGRKVFAFAGLADNGQFFDALRSEGLDVTGTRGFPDHHRYSDRDLSEIRRAAGGADAIVTTEKDAVKTAAGDIVPIPVQFLFETSVFDRIAAVVER